MTKPVRCNDLRRAQRGDALLEALIGILLLAILGLGLSYAASRVLTGQRYAATHGIVVAQMRDVIEKKGITDLCTNPHTVTFTPKDGSAISVELPPAHCEKHDVTIGTDDPALTVTLPQAAVTRMSFSTPDSEAARGLLGTGSIVLSQ